MAKITWDSFDTEDTNALEDKYLPARGEAVHCFVQTRKEEDT